MLHVVANSYLNPAGGDLKLNPCADYPNSADGPFPLPEIGRQKAPCSPHGAFAILWLSIQISPK